MRKPLLIGALVLVLVLGVVVLAGALGGYAYFFSAIRTAPTPLALATPSATPAGTPAGSVTGELGARWTVASGSQAGYRVSEQFVGQPSPHDAVARTSAVSGELAVQEGPSGLVATGLKFVVQLAQLQSVDQVAGYNVSQRDRFVGGALGVQKFPTASFEAQSATLSPPLTAGQQVTVSIPGQITIHGITRAATATVQVQLSGAQVQAAGSLPVDMTSFGVTPPQVPFTKSDSKVTIEFQLVLARAAV